MSARVRRRLLGGAALAVLLAGTLGVHLWFDSAPGFALRSAPVERARDGVAVVDGNTLVYREARFDPSDITAPDGTRVLSVQLDVTRVSEDRCDYPQLTETSGARRTWLPANRVVGSGDALGDDTEATCSGFADQPYTIRTVYLLPPDAEGPFVLDFPTSPAGDRTRFDVIPR